MVYRLPYIGAYGSYKTKIKFSSDGFSITDSTEITIYASGYSELTFSIAADGSLVTTVSENSSNYDNITVGTNTVEEISDTTDSSEVSELNNTVEANRVNESLNDTTEVTTTDNNIVSDDIVSASEEAASEETIAEGTTETEEITTVEELSSELSTDEQ